MLGSLFSARCMRRLGALGLALAAGALTPLLLPQAQAETFDPDVPLVRVVGPPTGPAPRARIDGSRSGRTHTALPRLPVELWRREMPRINTPPVIDQDGEIVMALATRFVMRVSANGKERWRTRTGDARPLTAPVLTSDGSVVVVNEANEFWRIDREGKVRVRRALGGSAKQQPPSRARRPPLATPLALDDGSVVLALRDKLLRVDAGGEVVAQQRLPGGAVGGVVRWGKRFIVTSRTGTVWAWQPPGSLKRLGRLGGFPNGGAVLASKHTLLAVIDREQLVAMDLNTGAITPLVTGAAVMSRLEGPPTLDHHGVLLVTSSLGELLGFDSHGVLLKRTPLDNVVMFRSLDAGSAIPSIFRRAESRQSPGLISDKSGRLAFVRGTGRVGMLGPDNTLLILEGRLCRAPLAVLPAGPGRMLLACESGTLALYGERQP